jgi:organic radical activating enzyme
MTSIREAVRRMLNPSSPLPTGLYHYQAPLEDARNYRLHLRIEPDGSGLLVVNASTVLHLNQTAAEYAFHLVKMTPEEETAQAIAHRYRVSKTQAAEDFRNFKERIDLLIDRQDLDPEIFLGIEPTDFSSLSAPLRLDCALTYRVPENKKLLYADAPSDMQELTTAEWKQILNRAWEFGIPQVIFSGGEPTLREDLIELILHSELNGQVTGLVTNGGKLLEAEFFDSVMESGLDHIVILLQPELETSWQILSKLVEVDIFVTAHITITLENKELLAKEIARLKSIGIHALSLSVSDPRLDKTMFYMRDQIGEMDLPIVWELPIPFATANPFAMEPEQPALLENYAWMYVDPTGSLYRRHLSETKIGDLHTDSWNEVWQKISATQPEP